MNYRHAYHAGNFADCFKHALLVELVGSLRRKSAPFFVLDTHAGEGHYNLDEAPARRTAEADYGIRRLLMKPDAKLAQFLKLVDRPGLYPGSPTLVRGLLRENDYLVCCELHPADAASLKKLFRGDRQDEFVALADGLCLGHGRFSHGIFAGWYPIKHLSDVRSFHARMKASGIRNVLAIEIYLREATNPDRLNGCGLIVINPPYQFEGQAQLVAETVLRGVGDCEPGSGIVVSRLTNE